MHKRLPNFDRNRRDKLKTISYEEYVPRWPAAKKMKQLIDLLRNDPDFKNEFLEAKQRNENQAKKHSVSTAKSSDQWIT